jgi:hypothetical protein
MINPDFDNRASQLETQATESILFSSARRVRIAPRTRGGIYRDGQKPAQRPTPMMRQSN